MSISLRDQLLQAGLAKAKPVSRPEQRKPQPEAASRHNRKPAPRNPDLEQRKPEPKKPAPTRAGIREQQRQLRELRRKVKDLLREHQLNNPAAELAFHFIQGEKIKKLYLAADQQPQVLRAELWVAIWNDRCYLITPEIGARARDLFPEIPLYRHAPDEPTEPPAEDPAYAGFAVPDDLNW